MKNSKSYGNLMSSGGGGGGGSGSASITNYNSVKGQLAKGGGGTITKITKILRN